LGISPALLMRMYCASSNDAVPSIATNVKTKERNVDI